MNKQQGFSFLELVISLMIFSIISCFTLSTYNHWRQQHERQLLLQELKQIIAYGRTQAVTYQRALHLVPIVGDDWAQGVALKTSEDELLSQWHWHLHYWQLHWEGAHRSQDIILAPDLSAAISNGTFP